MCPLFDYKCESCDEIIEDVFKRSTSDPVIECPSCGSEVTLRQALVGSSTFKLKGAGWYKDGYNKDNNNVNVKY